MSADRIEPFILALQTLRGRLREGRLPPGARVTAKDVVEELGLSATPVREALAQLAGEGLLEARRGDGYFVPGYDTQEIADLYRMSADLLLQAQAPGRRLRRDLEAPPGLDPQACPVFAVERLFATWAAESASRLLFLRHRSIAIRLAPVRALEPGFISDLAQEAQALLSLASPSARDNRGGALTAYHSRRIDLAGQLANALDPEGLVEL